MITVRLEQPDDRAAIQRVTIDAFTSSEFGHQGEAELVSRLRDRCANTLSLVACQKDVVVGHLLLSEAWIRYESGSLAGMGLAPMSVTPEQQKSGIGSAMIHSALQLLKKNGCPFVVVLGHPNYYPRFGFAPAADFKLQHGFTGIPQELLFVQFLAPETLQSTADGRVYYSPEFGPQWT